MSAEYRLTIEETRLVAFAEALARGEHDAFADGFSGCRLLRQAWTMPGLIARSAMHRRQLEGVQVIVCAREPLLLVPRPGDILLRIIEGGGSHASVVASPGLLRHSDLQARRWHTSTPSAHGYVHVVERTPAASRASDGFARGLTDSAGRLLDDLVLLQLATPPARTVTLQPSNEAAGAFSAFAAKEDSGDVSPFVSQAVDQCWSQVQILKKTLTAADNVSRVSRISIGNESKVTVDANPYSGMTKDKLEAVIQAGFTSSQMPHTLLALWAKEGSLRMVRSAVPVPGATTAANARALFRSKVYYEDLGADHFVLTRYDPVAQDNVWDNRDDVAPQHEAQFQAQVKALVGPGLLTQDISGAIDAELAVSSGPPFTVTPTTKFYSLSLLAMDAFFTSILRNTFPALTSLSETLNYMQWNIGTAKFTNFVASAEIHRQEPAFRLPSGSQMSIEQWALHTPPKAAEWKSPRVNNIRFLHYQNSYLPIFASAINLIKPGIEDLKPLTNAA